MLYILSYLLFISYYVISRRGVWHYDRYGYVNGFIAVTLAWVVMVLILRSCIK